MKKNLFIGLHDAEKDHFRKKSFPNYALMKSQGRTDGEARPPYPPMGGIWYISMQK